MARFLSLHTLACLTRQGAEELTKRLDGNSGIITRRLLWNLLEGKMLAEFEADSREALEAWLAKQGVHYEWLLRVEYESIGGRFAPA
jgi:hypothetical protein